MIVVNTVNLQSEVKSINPLLSGNVLPPGRDRTKGSDPMDQGFESAGFRAKQSGRALGLGRCKLSYVFRNSP